MLGGGGREVPYSLTCVLMRMAPMEGITQSRREPTAELTWVTGAADGPVPRAAAGPRQAERGWGCSSTTVGS